jgi:glycosyltransferase involved in cell wall biosynthesis
MALASRSFFSRTIVLTMGKTKKQSARGVGSTVFLCTTGIAKATPFPISALFDPVRLLAFLIHGLALSVQFRPSCIVVSMPPIETGFSGFLLSRLLQNKLIIDYMDDWESSMSSQLTRYIPKMLMRPSFKCGAKIYSSSMAIFVATPTLAEAMRQRSIKSSVILVPNGADSSIFFPRDERSRKQIKLRLALPLGKTVVAYCGSGLNPYYRLDLIFLAANSLSKIAREKIFFVFYLYSGIEHCRKLKDALKISDDLVEIREPLPRRDLSEVMAACDIGLVPFDDKPFLLYAMSTKVYEYLSAGLYVVGSGPRGGELDSFFSQNNSCGIFVRPRVDEFARVFHKTMKDAEVFLQDESRSWRHSLAIENFDSRKIMTKAMAHLISLEADRSD